MYSIGRNGYVMFHGNIYIVIMVRVEKNDADIRNAFPKCIRGTAVMQIKRFLLKKQKASSEEHCVCTHISFQNAVQLRLWIFWSCVCNGEAAQWWKWFLKMCVAFIDAYCILLVVNEHSRKVHKDSDYTVVFFSVTELYTNHYGYRLCPYNWAVCNVTYGVHWMGATHKYEPVGIIGSIHKAWGIVLKSEFALPRVQLLLEKVGPHSSCDRDQKWLLGH